MLEKLLRTMLLVKFKSYVSSSGPVGVRLLVGHRGACRPPGLHCSSLPGPAGAAQVSRAGSTPGQWDLSGLQHKGLLCDLKK